MDSTQFATVVGVISAAVGGILTWASTQGINALLKYRADHREDKKLQAEQNEAHHDKEENTLRFIIGRQDGEMTSLRSEIKEMQFAHREELRSIHHAHNECEKRHAELATELRIRMETMASRVEAVEQHVVDPKEAARQTVDEMRPTIRHEIRNELHADKLKHDLEKMQAEAKSGDIVVTPRKEQPE